MSIRDTRRLLRRWGRWASGGVAGYPTASAFARLAVKSTNGWGSTDPELIACDAVIARSEAILRRVLLKHYVAWGSAGDKANRLGISRTVYYRRLSDAEWYVHTELDKAGQICDEAQIVRLHSANA